MMGHLDWHLTLVLLTLTYQVEPQQWMYLAVSSVPITTEESCGYVTQKLSHKQKSICSDNYAIMRSLMDGAKLALQECQQQFMWERWNCSAHPEDDNSETPFGKALLLGTRESAFLSAIFSAGLAYSVIEDCSQNRLPNCRCLVQQDKFESTGIVHRGCDINLDFGLSFSKNFLDQQSQLSGNKNVPIQRKLMYEHNYETGRQVLRDNIARSCRCHGVSGACSLKVCSKELPNFRQVGNVLKEAYAAAVQVTLDTLGSNKVLVKKIPEATQVWQTDLVYFEASPDYCIADPKAGIPGTVGRRCNKLDHQQEVLKHGFEATCDNLCCGRKVDKSVLTMKKNCNCKFHWCCKVTCDTCVFKRIVYACQ